MKRNFKLQQRLRATAGRTLLNGVSLGGSTLTLNGGTLSGVGTINASVVNAAEISPGASPGTITVNGNYTQTSAGVMKIELGGAPPGTQFDQLNVTGTASLDGALNVSLINGFSTTNREYFSDPDLRLA